MPAIATAPKSAPKSPRNRAAVTSVTLQRGTPWGKKEGPAVALVGKDAFEQARLLLASWRKEGGNPDLVFSVQWANGFKKEGWYGIPTHSKADDPDLGAFLYETTCNIAEGEYAWLSEADAKAARALLETLAFCEEEAGR